MSKKRKKSRIRWRTPPFRVMYYGFCPSPAAWEREKKRAFRRGGVQLHDYPGTRGMTISWRSIETSCLYVLVTIDEALDGKDEAMVAMAHECLHVAKYVSREMADGSPSEETEAYLLSAIMEKLLADYRRTRSRDKRRKK